MKFLDRLRRKKGSPEPNGELTASIPGEDIPAAESELPGGEQADPTRRFSFGKAKTAGKARAGKQARGKSKIDPEAPVDLEFVDQGVVRIGGRLFALNLTWVSAVDTDSLKSHADTARKVAASRKQADNDFTFYAGSKADGFLGFGSADAGHKRGMPVLIESFNPAVMGGNWLAVRPIEGSRDQWWVGGRRGGDVFEDRVLGSKDAAAALFTEALAAPGWATIVAPEDWRVRNSVPSFPAGALDSPQEKLHLVDPVKAYAPRVIAVGIVLTALLGGSYYFYDKHQRHLAEMEELRRQIERAVTLQPQDHPWYHRTRIDHFLAHCEREILQTMIMVPGWENEVFTCKIDKGRGQVSTGWRRAGGNIAWLRAAMPQDYPAINVNAASEAATVTRTFEAPTDPEAFRRDPWTRAQIENRLTERFQLHGIPLSMRYVADNRPAETNPLFHRHDVQIQGDMGLTELLPFLGDIPALIPDTLSYNVATASWSLVVRIHHPVIVPEFKP